VSTLLFKPDRVVFKSFGLIKNLLHDHTHKPKEEKKIGFFGM